MCRIAGIFDPSADNVEADVTRMRDAMSRGGPDDQGIFVHSSLRLAFGHRRLSIVDLTDNGHQPMHTSDGRLWLSYNGEIYNYRELRNELKQLGYSFNGNSDTEVVLVAYEHWGYQAFSRLNGMFALSIWDAEKSEIVVARDHAGIKPLYVHLSDKRLVFASEIRAFQALDASWASNKFWPSLMLMFGHLPEPFTTLEKVFSVQAGTYQVIAIPTLARSVHVYGNAETGTRIDSEQDAIQSVRSCFTDVIRRQLLSDAPIGTFLSGGLDSSIVTMLASTMSKDLRTVSINFEEADFSELKYQQLVSEKAGVRHLSYRISREEFESALPEVMQAMDQPTTDGINSFFISKKASDSGLKAVLSGIGADEVFGGYPSFRRFQSWQKLRRLPEVLSDMAGIFGYQNIARLSHLRFSPMISLYLVNRGFFTLSQSAEMGGVNAAELREIVEQIHFPAVDSHDSLEVNALMEREMYLRNQLLRDTDMMSMWHGLEVRVPFLDKQLLDTAARMSPHLRYTPAIPKKLLIDAFADILPIEIGQRQKQGFTFPFKKWFRETTLLQPTSQDERKLYRKFMSGDLHWSRYWALKLIQLR